MNAAMNSLPDGIWNLNPDATTLTVTTMKMKVITVPATLTVTSGTITVGNGNVTEVQIAADASSYKSSQKLRDKEVLGGGFLDAGQYPTITFAAANGSAEQVAGEVTVKDKTAPLTFTISALNIDGDTATFTATAKVDRIALGVTRMPAFVIANELDIVVQATAAAQF